jgi:hypothetical protein
MAADASLAVRLTSMLEAQCRAALAGDGTKLAQSREWLETKALDAAGEVDRARAAWDQAREAVDTTRSAVRAEAGRPRYAASVKTFSEAELEASGLRRELGIALGKATSASSLLDVIDNCSKRSAAPSAARAAVGSMARFEPGAADAEIQAAAEFTASAIILTLETLRIREAAGEIDAAQRRQEVRAAIERLRNSPIDSAALDVLRDQRRRAADALQASARSQLAGARWPPGDEPSTYEEWSRIELDFARSHRSRIDETRTDLTWTLRPVAMVLGWTEGRTDGDMVFNGLEQEIETAISRTLSNLSLVAPVAPSATKPTAGGADRGPRTIEIAAARDWTATGVVLAPGAAVMIQASGTVEASASQDRRAFFNQVPPGGRGEFLSSMPQPVLPALSLIGRIGEGPVLPIGAEARLSATPPYGSGELFLGINDDSPQDNSGAWTVRITVSGDPTAPPPSPVVVAPAPPPPPPVTPPPPPSTADQGKWTAWLNRDQPRDSADLEGLAGFGSAVPCPQPLEVQCRAVDGRDWSATGQRYTCSLEGPNPGGLCINSENPGGCLDYEVRFRCP